MSIDKILSQVKKKRQTGKNSWMCQCPSHNDRGPSLKVTQAEDGAILIHCFAGCEPLDILGAIGLVIEDLFPDDMRHVTTKRLWVNPRDALIALKTEFMIVMLSALDLRKGRALNDTDMSRLSLAYDRFSNAVEIARIE